MRSFEVNGRPCYVRDPCYIVPDTIVLRIDVAAGTGEAWCQLLFPRNDPAIKDRVPIVNSATLQYGCWNLTNIAASYLRRGRLIIRRASYQAFGIVHPGTVVDAHLTGILRQDGRGRACGSAKIVLARNRETLFAIKVQKFTEFRT